MPVTLVVAPAARVGVVRLAGTVVGPELVAAAAQLAGHADWRPGFRAVWDAGLMTNLDFGIRDLGDALAQERRLRAAGESGDVVVVAEDSIWLALVRLFDRRMGAAGRAIHTVPTPAEAARVLGLDALPA